MENTLTVKNFLIFKNAEITLREWTILIGPQASGKSLLAKLVFFFYEMPQYFKSAILSELPIEKVLSTLFLRIFPKEYWAGTDFSIELKTGLGKISVENTGEKLSFHLSEYYQTIYQQKKAESAEKKMQNDFFTDMFDDFDFGICNKGNFTVFIPAGRSFFALLGRNIFTLLSQGVQPDYIISSFGKIYEQLKPRKSGELHWNGSPEKLLKGSYQYDESRQKERIRLNSGGTVDVQDASSGQQELLPVLLTVYSLKSRHFGFILEEPEAHIFPESQFELVNFLVESSKNFCLTTTHSPYILTALNNAVYAGQLSEKFADDPVKMEELNKIIPEKNRIAPSRFSAYLLENGTAQNIVDPETGLVNGEAIDSASNKTSDIFDQLLAMESE